MTAADAFGDLRARYVQAQLAGDRREAVRLVIEEGLGRGVRMVEIQSIVRDAQIEIGRLWECNQVSIAQEHMATAITQLVLAVLFERVPPAAPLGRSVLLACVEGELHDLPTRMAADVLELEGFEVRNLGANVPSRDLAQLVARLRPDAVGLAVTMTFNVPALRGAVAAIREALDVPIFVGGRATEWSTEIATELGIVDSGTAVSLIATARRLTGLA